MFPISSDFHVRCGGQWVISKCTLDAEASLYSKYTEKSKLNYFPPKIDKISYYRFILHSPMMLLLSYFYPLSSHSLLPSFHTPLLPRSAPLVVGAWSLLFHFKF